MIAKHLLAINTASGSCNVGVSRDGFIYKSKEIIATRGYSEILGPLIGSVLKESQVEVNQLSGFLVCNGPGNYTSLRIAISMVRGLSLACNKPACSVSLFELMSTKDTKALVLVKGPAEKIYVQSFSLGIEVNSPRLMTVSEIKNTKEFFESQTVGYRAGEIAKLIKSKSYLEVTEVTLEKLLAIGQKKLSPNCPKPVPIYIR